MHRLETRAEVDELIRLARTEGVYGFVTTADEVAEIGGFVEREREVFGRLKLAALEEWLALADERLAGARTRAYLMPGNDDPPQSTRCSPASRTLATSRARRPS